VKLMLLFASVSLAPAIMAVLTSFMRIIVVLFFLRAGLGSAQIIPTPVLIGFAIILTVCTMAPTLQAVNQAALAPLLAGRVSLGKAAQAAEAPLRAHLTARARPDDLQFVSELTPPAPAAARQPALANLCAAYVLSELRAGFFMGFVIYLPFMVIDLVVASTLTSLGMLSLPQAAVSLPFKVLLFVMVDGWRLLTDALLTSLR
jgi:flagellar biosynthetic protein FliP